MHTSMDLTHLLRHLYKHDKSNNSSCMVINAHNISYMIFIIAVYMKRSISRSIYLWKHVEIKNQLKDSINMVLSNTKLSIKRIL